MPDKPLNAKVKASEARGSAPQPSNPVAPEYRELHELYCRCAEIREALLLDRAMDWHLRSPLFGELLGQYAGLGNEAAKLLIFLQTQLPAEPALFDAWRKAAMRSRVVSGDEEKGSQAIQEENPPKT